MTMSALIPSPPSTLSVEDVVGGIADSSPPDALGVKRVGEGFCLLLELLEEHMTTFAQDAHSNQLIERIPRVLDATVEIRDRAGNHFVFTRLPKISWFVNQIRNASSMQFIMSKCDDITAQLMLQPGLVVQQGETHPTPLQVAEVAVHQFAVINQAWLLYDQLSVRGVITPERNIKFKEDLRNQLMGQSEG